VEIGGIVESIAACVKTVLAQPDWNMKRLASELNVTPDTIRKVLRGDIAEPRFSFVAGIHIIANRSLDEVLGIDSVSETNSEVMTRLNLVESRLKTQEMLTAQVMLQLGGKEADPAASMPLRRIADSTRQGASKTTGRRRDDALPKKTAEKDAKRKPARAS
jgi:transcriptional regulator with XRE-family HTH domain